MLVLNVVDTRGKGRVEVRGKRGYESGRYDRKDKLHKFLDKLDEPTVAKLFADDEVVLNPNNVRTAPAIKAVKDLINEDGPCWDTHKQVGMKKKGGRMVPNCVPKNEEPRIPRKKGQPAGSDKHSDLYTDENPVGTIHGLGFKDVETAKASVKKIIGSGKSHAHKIQAAIAMEQRAKEMGKTAEAAIYRKYIDKMKEKTKQMQKEDAEDDRLQKTIKVATAKTNIAKRIKNMKVQQKAALKNIKDKDRKKARSDDMKKKMQQARDDGKREIKQIQKTFEAQKEDIDITGLRTQLVKKMFSKQKYDVYHSNFSSMIQHIADMAKKLYGITIDPKTVTDTAKNKNKPKAGVTKKFSLKGDKGSIKAFIYNRGGLENPFELRMYQEDLETNEELDESLWANIHKKRQRIKRGSGEKMRKKGEKGAPTPAQMKRAKGEEIEEKAPDTADAMKRYKAGKAGFTDIAHLKATGKIKRADGTKKKSPKYEESELNEWGEVTEKAEYDGRPVALNNPTKGDRKKYKVYVKNEKGNVVKVEFGDPNMEIKRDDPGRRANFRARHNCDNPGPKYKARYWSCKFWSAKSVTDLMKG